MFFKTFRVKPSVSLFLSFAHENYTSNHCEVIVPFKFFPFALNFSYDIDAENRLIFLVLKKLFTFIILIVFYDFVLVICKFQRKL